MRIVRFLALTWLFAIVSPTVFAAVTYDGTAGVSANIFASNSKQACTACHSSALAGAARSSAPVGVNFDTYAQATSGTNESRAVVRINAGTMPPAGALSGTEMTLITQWQTDGYVQNAAPEVHTTNGSNAATTNTATLNGTVFENGSDSSVQFRYSSNSTTLAFGGGTTVTATSPAGTGGGTTAGSFSKAISGLSCGTTYFFVAEADNAVSSSFQIGETRNFTTSSCPTISTAAVTTATESVAYSYDVNATAGAGGSYTFALTTKPTGMTINASTGVISWTPPEATSSYTASVTVTATDSSGSGSQSYTINVSANNDAPSISTSAVTTATEDTAYSYDVNATDPESQTITYSLSVKPTGMTINSSTGVIAWTPDNSQSGMSHNVTVQAGDGTTNTPQSFMITVTAVNDAPVISTAAVTTATENTAYSYDVNATDVDSVTLTYSLTTKPTGMTINSATGVISWTPSDAQGGTSQNVTVQVDDNSGTGTATTTQSFTVNVTAVNDAPVISTSAVTTATENTAYSYDVDASDIDSVTLTYSLTTKPTGMTINASTGMISWTPSDAQGGTSQNVTVQVDDNSGTGTATTTQSFTVNVTAVNDAPVISTSAVMTATENAAYSYDVDASDIDSVTLTYSLTTKPTGMTINASTGVISWTPSDAQGGTSQNVTVQVDDNSGTGTATDTQSFTINVTAVNDAPVISTSAVTTATENTAYSYDVDASDIDSVTLTYSLTTNPTGMTIDPNTGVISWTPSDAQGGTSQNVTVQVDDNSGTGTATTTQSFTVNVTAVNDAPVVSTSAVTTATENTAYSYDVDASDIDSVTLTYSLTTKPAGMAIDPNTGVISWTPADAQGGTSQNVTVQVDDNSGTGTATTTQSFTVNVTAVNDAPVISTSAVTSATEGSAYSYDVNASDIDSVTLTYSLTTKPAGMTIDANTGVISWTPSNAQGGTSQNVTVQVDDNSGTGTATDTQSFAINVTAVNDAPVISTSAITTATEGSAYSYDVDATDIDSATLTYSLTTKPTGMTIDSNTGVISWMPTNAQGGTSQNVTVQVDDGALTDTQSFSIAVTAVNDAPTITSSAVTTATESVVYHYDVNATDIDSGTLTYSLTVKPSGMSINATTGMISWTPTNAQSGASHNVTVRVSDGTLTDTQSFSIAVTAVNNAPVFSSAAVTAATEDLAYSYDVNATDLDSVTLTYSLTVKPTGMTIDANTGVISWTPTNAQSGVSQNVTVQVDDNSGTPTATATQSFSITVVAVNDAPVISTTAVTTATEDIAYSYDVDASDIDSATLTYSLTTSPSGMTIDANTGVISWTPTNAQGGMSHNVTVQVDDNSGAGNALVTQAFSIAVTAVNDAPQITSSAPLSAIEATAYSYQVGVNDPDDSGAGLAFSLPTAPAGMTISTSGLVQWTPPNGVTSTDVTVQVADGGEDGALPATQSWTISVSATNTPPSITSTAGTTATEDIAYSYAPTVSDADDANNGVDLTWTLLTAPTGMSVGSTGVVSWTPTNAQSGASYNVTLQVADGGESGAMPDTQSWTIDVTAVNDAPVITTSAITTGTEDTAYSYDVDASDVDNTTLTYALDLGPAGMTINTNTGEISWTPNNAQSGLAWPVTVSVTDGTATVTQSFTLNITAVNDIPVISTTPVTTGTEDTAYSYDVDASDVETPSLVYALDLGPPGMTINTGTGVVSWTPTNPQSGLTWPVTVSVTDGTDTVTQSFTISVTAVNDAPVISTTAVTAATEDSAYTYDVDATDVDSTTLTYSLTTAPSGMTIDSSTGVISWTPDNSQSGTGHTVTVQVSDGALTDTQTFTLNVAAVNDAPVISTTAITAGTEDTAYSYDVDASDVDNATLTYALDVGPAGMTINTSTGVMSWTPTNAQSGSGWPVTVSVTDGTATVTQSFTVTVAAVNDAPVISTSATTTATEDASYSYDVDASDVDNTTLTYTLTTSPIGMSIDANTGVISWTPDNSQSGTGHTVTVQVSDGALADTQTFTLNVAAVNDAPVISTTATTAASEDTAYTYDVDASDIDNATLTYALDVGPSGMTINTNTGVISWTPDNSQAGSTYPVTVSVSDGALTDTQSFNIPVAAVNDAPVISTTAITAATEDTAYTYDVDASDIDSTTLTYSLTTSPSGMSIDTNTGVISWTPDNAQSGAAYTVTVQVSDSALTDTQTFTVNVAVVNDAPVISTTAGTNATEDSTFTYDVDASDIDNATLTYALDLGPAGMTINTTTGVISWTPTNAQAGSGWPVTVSVTDGALTDTQSFTVTVAAVNDAPTIDSAAQTGATEDVNYVYAVQASDVDSATLTYALNVGPSGMTINTGTGVISWTPDNNDAGNTYPVSVSVSDGSLTTTQAFNLNVIAVNDAPTIDSTATLTGTEDAPYVYAVQASDIDSATLTYSLTTKPTGMSINANTGVITWIPDNAQSGASSNVTVQVSDGALTDTQSFSINVAAVNDAPTIDSSAVTTAAEDIPYSYPVIASDVDNVLLSYALDLGPAGMTINTVTGEISWTPTNAQSGNIYPVSVSVSDGALAATQSFTVSVTAVNDPPVLNPITAQTATELSTLQVDTNVIDPDDANDGSGELTWSIAATDAPGTVNVSNTGTVTYTPAQDSAGTYSVTVQVADGGENGAAPATQTFALTINKLDADNDTVADYHDNCRITANADQADHDGDGVAGGDGNATSPSNIGGDACDDDDDNDGIPDATEVAHLLDPQNASDAAGDLDGDGISNLQEFIACGTDTNCAAMGQDSSAPLIFTSGDQEVIATGYYTPVTLTATATDMVFGLPVTVNVTQIDKGPFRPGAHVVHWLAVDAAGNSATQTQNVNVVPTITLGGTRIVGEGQTASLQVLMNGESPQYPVEVSYDITGITSADTSAPLSGTVTISSGTEAWITVPITADSTAEADENFTVTLTGVTAGKAALSAGNVASTVRITEQPTAPQIVALQVVQDDPLLPAGQDPVRDVVFSDGGIVTVTILTQDVNGNPLTYDWSRTNPRLIGTASGTTFHFSPKLVAAGSYEIVMRVSDGSFTTERRLMLVVQPHVPVLSASTDSDGDGSSDAAEGAFDTDQDGLLDYLDPVDAPGQAALVIDTSEDGMLQIAVAQPGVVLAAGPYAAGLQTGGISVPISAITDITGTAVPDENWVHIGAIYDVELRNVAADGTVSVMLPLPVSLAPSSQWREFINGAWFAFSEGAHDVLQSAASSNGICPSLTSAAWQSGLVAGNDCARVTLSDGGPNDADGEVNGVVRLPSGPAIRHDAVNNEPVSHSAGAFDTRWLLMLVVFGVLRRHLPRARHYPAMKKIIAAFVLTLFGTAAAAEESAFSYDGEIGLTQDSNVSRAGWKRDIIDSAVIDANAGISWNHEFSLMKALTVRGFASTEQFIDVPTMSHAGFGLSGIYRWQRELGFTAPFWQASLTLQSDEAEAALRSNNRYAVQLFRTQRVTDLIRYSAGVEGVMKDAQGIVFDGTQLRLFINGDYALRDPWALYATYGLAQGDTVSSARQVFCNGTLAPDIYPLIAASKNIEPDQALNADTCGTWLAYRLPATTHMLVGGINRGFGHHMSLDISVQHVWVFADGNNEYERTQIRAGVVGSF